MKEKELSPFSRYADSGCCLMVECHARGSPLPVPTFPKHRARSSSFLDQFLVTALPGDHPVCQSILEEVKENS